MRQRREPQKYRPEWRMIMEEQKKKMDGSMAENSENEKEMPETEAHEAEEDRTGEPAREPGLKGYVSNLPARTYTVWIAAGLYLVYSGYQLCKGKLEGVPDSSWGFFAAGVGFELLALFLLAFGIRGLLIREKEKKAEQAQADEKKQNVPASEDSRQKKTDRPISIAERARLASHLDDTEVEEESVYADGDAEEPRE